MIAGLDDKIVEAYGVSVATGTMVSSSSASAATMVLAAEQIGLAIGDIAIRARPLIEVTWPPLPPSEAAPPPADALERFLAWTRAAGARFDGIEIRVGPDGNRTAHAVRAIAKGERVIEIPRALLITNDDIAATAIGRAISELGPAIHSGHTTIAAWLVIERADPGSRWQPFLQVLPPRLSDVGFLRGGGNLAELAGVAARESIAEARTSVVTDHEALGWTHELDGVSLADFAWARSIVGSRAYKLSIAGVERRALVPIADLLDHAGVAGVSWHFDDASDAFAITAERDFVPGDEVCASYGKFGNPRFVTHYGFAMPHNPADDGLLVFGPADDVRFDLAAHLLWDLPLAAPAGLTVATRFDDRFRRALSLARLRACRYSELVRAADRGRFRARELQWLDASVESAALAAIADAARAGIAHLDAHPAPPPSPTSWQRVCAVIRAGEREILGQVIAFTAAVAPHVANATAHAWRRIAETTPAEAIGPDRLLREYLLAVATELPR